MVVVVVDWLWYAGVDCGSPRGRSTDVRIRAFPNAVHCLGGNGPRTYMWTFIRVLSFLVVSMLRTFGRSQCGGDVDDNGHAGGDGWGVDDEGVAVMRVAWP